MKTAPFLYRLATFLLILLWVYAALSKLIEFRHFREEMYNQVIPAGVATLLIYALPAAELLAAGLLAGPKKRTAGLYLSCGLLLLFTGYVGLVWAGYFDRVPCTCGGVLQHLGWGAHLLFNLFFLLLTTAALVIQPAERRLRTQT